MTERVEHTAGPWKAVKGIVESDDMRCGVSAVRGKTEYLVATIENGAPGDFCETEEANARLIAAAPDLLAACQEFVRKVECGEAKSTRSYEQMKAAISKATGEA